MAMLNDDSLSHSELRHMFNSARQRNLRYFAVIEQILEDRYMVTVSQGSFVTNDANDIVRQLREQGLRPSSPTTRLSRVFDTRADFNAQLQMGREAMLSHVLPADAKAAHDRYLEDVQKKKEAAQNTGKGLFARLFSR